MLKDRLKECRLLNGYSQQQVADVLKVHRSTYSYYELGHTEPSLDNMRILAKVFNVSVDWLLEVERQKSPLTVGTTGVYEEGFALLEETDLTRVSELSRDEKMLIMRFRLMTKSQRRELLDVMCNPDGEEIEE